jgi:hypothetical protein
MRGRRAGFYWAVDVASVEEIGSPAGAGMAAGSISTVRVVVDIRPFWSVAA